ncbi:hypothetical protein [Photobacterium salinisoli]|uniref:hypothetical protein n=1 Tax=Photobacterium salinisoli TaxID=1616783 RepID=UPI0013C3F840|nr:hypothetical protein [Photobacterium salinisoli]
MCPLANGKLISICGRDQLQMYQYGRPGYVELALTPMILCTQSSIGMVPDDRETETLLSQYRSLVPAEFGFETWVNQDQDLDEYRE